MIGISDSVFFRPLSIALNRFEPPQFQKQMASSGPDKLLNKLDDIDKMLSDKIANLNFGKFIECIIVIPTLMFSPIGIPIFIVVTILYFKTFGFLVAFLLGLVFSEGIKKIAQRPRPTLQSHKPLNITQHLMHVNSYSMPSGDSLQSAVFAVIVSYHLELTDWAYIFIPWAAFGRVYWGNHWIGDTIAGAFIGTMASLIICLNFNDLMRHNFY